MAVSTPRLEADDASTLATRPPPPSAAAALQNLKVFSALRDGDHTKIQPFLDDLRSSPENAGRLLGMAAQVAPVATLQLILNHVSNPNLPIAPNTTATALHVASEKGRADAVKVLLDDARINDTIKDDQRRTPLECSANEEVAALIDASRARLQERYAQVLAEYIGSPLSSVEESENMSDFLKQPRIEAVNLNALDHATGSLLLHEAARRRDLRLVELSVKKGGDVFARDRRGKRVLEGDKNPDERIKAYIRQFSNQANQDNMAKLNADGTPPNLKGYLSKWVNYRQGWKTRWFVIKDGVLSYYRNRDDEQVACRGSIALATANLTQTEDGMRFEISSAVSTSVPKISVKSDRAEIVRWVQAIRLNQDYYSTGGRKKIDRVPSSSNTTKSPSINSHMNELPPADTFLHPGLKRSGTVLSGISSSTTTPQSPRVIRKPSAQSTIPPATGNVTSSDAASSFADQGSLYDDREDSQGHSIPYESEFSLGMLDLDARLKLTQELVGSIVTPPSSAKNSPDPSRPASSTTSRQQEVKDALRDSLVSITALVHKQHEMALEREKFFQTRIKREVQARKLWEDNLLAVAEQQAETDLQLKEAAKDNERKRRALRQARGVLAEFSLSTPASPGGEPSVLAGNNVVETPERENSVDLGAPPTGVSGSQLSASLRNTLTRGGHGSRRSFSLTKSKSRASISAQEFSDVVAAIDDSEDDDDEFFDAIETGTIPNLKMYDSIAHPERPSTPSAETPAANKDAHAQAKEGTIAQLLARESLEPYNHVRHRLPIDDDKRPSVSLWSILKSSIGKDLTKITFPVSFNECTSMLQRMAEDMEYDACLTVAASEQDSLKRVAFVAAFAMSNYSSTIGRIAKPFNPLLSQTFEYAIPNRYRYVSEQVSHHPPVSACYCEAPTWKYYGEVDAKNKFQGSYFEIRPTGIAHAELIIPRSWVPANLQHKYPDAGPEYPDGYVIEHYSWKKVITNVSNFLMGNPIIDHYGDLVVTNHRTGETSTLTFKPRGWRRKDACEIKGDVRTADGEVEWEIAGRWDSQLIARRAGMDAAPLGVNDEVTTSKEYMQLWRNTDKPKAPFNLTPYAVTLNDIPTGLRPYLAPTDCRLRTDMRAFEDADYEAAQRLKTLNEEFQRETRKLRAEGKIPQHEPRWFTDQVDADSGERVWVPKRATDGEVKFWAEREVEGHKNGQKWPEVDEIFKAHE